ncbi:MAG: VOC family protein [Anaerolineales bacterium]|nr:VOC family protein [Anaerolineales bacterium]
MMIKQLAHINIGAYDLKASEDFYCNILGLKKIFEFIKDGELFGFYAGTGNTTFVEVFLEEEKEKAATTLLHHLCLEVEDLEAAITEIRSKGWEISDKTLGGDNSWQAWISDPSGVQIELMQYTNESSQFTGRPCEVDW